MNLSPTQIIEHVARYYHVKPEQLRGRSRVQHIARARMIAMYLIRDSSDAYSHKGVAAFLGCADHTTSLNAIKVVRARMIDFPHFAMQIAEISETLTSAPEIPALVDV